MDADAAADELYGLRPDRFTARRGELVAQAKRDGDPQARTAIEAMRRPTVAAWAVNLLVRERPDEVNKLLELAGQLREAQRALRGDQLRELSVKRHAAVAALARDAAQLAAATERAINDGTVREVQATLDAAVADENAETAVRTGRLTTALAYSGFGEVDISDAVAALDARPRLQVVRPPAPAAPSARAKPAPARGRGTAPSRAAMERERKLAGARDALAAARKHRDDLLAEAEQLRRRLQDTERELRPAEAAVRSAERRLHEREQR
ncbi:MAG TPA: hypothetical protein VGH01_05520 [Jatrophihabitantaceae bacterium]